MGILNQGMRYLKSSVGNLFRGKKKKKKPNSTEEIEVPRAWIKPDAPVKSMPVIIKYKRRIPGLRTFKRILAAILLIINFGFSQFLLGSIGTQAQPMFFLFLLNSFVLIDYLWKTRRTEH